MNPNPVPVGPPPGPFLKSLGYCSTDTGAIPIALMQGFNTVAIVDVSEAPSYPGCIIMSSLLPHPSLVSMILNTDRSDPNYQQIDWMYHDQYYRFFGSPERESVMANIAASMYKTNHPILFYVEPDVERQFDVLKILRTFLAKQMGIVIGDFESLMANQPNAGFNDNPQYRAVILDLLFINGYITKEEYSVKMPDGILPSPRAINIILSDYDNAFNNMEASVRAACNVIAMYKYQILTGKTCPVIQVAKELDAEREQQIRTLVSNSNTRFGNKTIGELNQIAANRLQSPQ